MNQYLNAQELFRKFIVFENIINVQAPNNNRVYKLFH